MESSHDAGWLNKYGTLATLIAMALAGASWVFGLAGKVENNQEQIAALQVEVANRRGAMSLIEAVQRDLTRLEKSLEEAHEDMERARGNTSFYKELVARQGEHIDSVDERVGRIDDRLEQAERMLGRRYENGLGHSK